MIEIAEIAAKARNLSRNTHDGIAIEEYLLRQLPTLSSDAARDALTELDQLRDRVKELDKAELISHPDRYVISGIVAEGEHVGEKVCIRWTPESGGWWQWSPSGWAERFEKPEGARFEDALRSAKNGCGPWYYRTNPETVKVEAVPAIVTVTVR